MLFIILWIETPMNKIVSEEEWIEARKALLKKEMLKDKVAVRLVLEQELVV